ncbi:BTB/POZ domain-containing protein [Perilla frutescens var. hirtella]|uniref:BTB/POZ domain-containing protein n=1 Tax=Perilla frutescens var. hirtella TaxID=608512 RepID=A0AAD4ITS4_PERFH|nr:BTB/POZ domain-containing protein [Perilla frutescens var. hirtella]
MFMGVLMTVMCASSNFIQNLLTYHTFQWLLHLSVEKSRSLFIKLYPEISNLTRDNPPIASFVIRVVSSVGDRKCSVHPGKSCYFILNYMKHSCILSFRKLYAQFCHEVTDKKIKSNEDFIWSIEVPLTGKFIIDVEFLDLKTASPDGADPCSIWSEGFPKRLLHETALTSLGRMLSESIHTDIVINASDGSVTAHRAVLASRSPVFRSMFSHDLKEKELSAIDISDMSIEACRAFLNYIYGSIRNEEFLTHRLALLRAADKYDILDLKEACHESLLEDIDTRNVLERLQNASLYQLPQLKSSCMRYLVKFGKIYDIRDDFNVFLQCADRELIAEIFNEILAAWKGF